MTGDNAPPIDGWTLPERDLRRCCGIDQATTHCGTCGYLIPPTVARVVEPIDDWPYTLMDGLGTN